MGSIKVRNAGLWKPLKNAWVRDAGVWKPILDMWFRYNQSWARLTPFLQEGDEFEGGYYAGQITIYGVGAATHYLIVSPKALGRGLHQWKTTNTFTSGTASTIDGPTNTASMNNSSHPAAQFCAGLTINGYSDWYMPASDELDICYYSLKPTTNNNDTNYGVNYYSIPKRLTNYSLTNPEQTTAVNFRDSNSESFVSSGLSGQFNYYSRSSTQPPSPFDSLYSVSVSFNTGAKVYTEKRAILYVRAVRRVAI